MTCSTEMFLWVVPRLKKKKNQKLLNITNMKQHCCRNHYLGLGKLQKTCHYELSSVHCKFQLKHYCASIHLRWTISRKWISRNLPHSLQNQSVEIEDMKRVSKAAVVPICKHPASLTTTLFSQVTIVWLLLFIFSLHLH